MRAAQVFEPSVECMHTLRHSAAMRVAGSRCRRHRDRALARPRATRDHREHLPARRHDPEGASHRTRGPAGHPRPLPASRPAVGAPRSPLIMPTSAPVITAISGQGRHNPEVGVIRIDPEDREREARGGVADRRGCPLLRLVAHRPGLRPPGRDVGDIQRETELALTVAALVADEIDLHEPWHCVVPLRPRPHRDRVLQQRARLGMRPASAR